QLRGKDHKTPHDQYHAKTAGSKPRRSSIEVSLQKARNSVPVMRLAGCLRRRRPGSWLTSGAAVILSTSKRQAIPRSKNASSQQGSDFWKYLDAPLGRPHTALDDMAIFNNEPKRHSGIVVELISKSADIIRPVFIIEDAQ